MVSFTNTITRSLTRFAFAFFALLMGVILISSFTMVNCAWAQDPNDDDELDFEWDDEGEVSWFYVGYNGGPDDHYEAKGCGEAIYRFHLIIEDDSCYSHLYDWDYETNSFEEVYIRNPYTQEKIYHMRGYSRTLDLIAFDSSYEIDDETDEEIWVVEPRKLTFTNSEFLAENIYLNLGDFTFDNSLFRVNNLYINNNYCVDEEENSYLDNSSGTIAFTDTTCEVDKLTIDPGASDESPKTVTLSGEFKVGSVDRVSGDVVLDDAIFNSNSTTTFNNFDTLTITGKSMIKVTQGSNLIFDNGDDNVDTHASVSIYCPEYEEGDNEAALKICCEADGQIFADSVFISSGRVDIKGIIEGNLEVGSGAEFSPGNSVGTTDVTGDGLGIFTVDDEAVLIIEQDSTGVDRLVVNQFSAPDENQDEQWLRLDIDGLALGSDYDIIYVNDGLTGRQLDDKYWTDHLTEDLPFYMTLSVLEDGKTVRLHIYHNAVPEPSTWALLVLGAAGLLYLRKREKNA